MRGVSRWYMTLAYPTYPLLGFELKHKCSEPTMGWFTYFKHYLGCPYLVLNWSMLVRFVEERLQKYIFTLESVLNFMFVVHITCFQSINSDIYTSNLPKLHWLLKQSHKSMFKCNSLLLLYRLSLLLWYIITFAKTVTFFLWILPLLHILLHFHLLYSVKTLYARCHFRSNYCIFLSSYYRFYINCRVYSLYTTIFAYIFSFSLG